MKDLTRYFDLATLSKRSGIELRKLRYCVDHRLLPTGYWFVAEDHVGRPRNFGSMEAVALCGAALMLEAGCRRETVRTFMGQFERLLKPGRNPLRIPLVVDSLMSSSTCEVQLGDGLYMRWLWDGTDTGWRSLSDGLKPVQDVKPAVVISLDWSGLRQKILGD